MSRASFTATDHRDESTTCVGHGERTFEQWPNVVDQSGETEWQHVGNKGLLDATLSSQPNARFATFQVDDADPARPRLGRQPFRNRIAAHEAMKLALVLFSGINAIEVRFQRPSCQLGGGLIPENAMGREEHWQYDDFMGLETKPDDG